MAITDDIASQLGVSVSTVTRVLNGDSDYRRPSYAKRAQHIRELAQQLGYRPNASAKAIREGRFNAVSLVTRRDSSFVPPTLEHGVYEALARHNMLVVLSFIAHEAIADEASVPKVFRELCVDGLLIHEAMDTPPAVARMIRKHQIPVVWVNSKTSKDGVYPDEVSGTYQATRRLLELGHRRIAYVEYLVDYGTGAPMHYSAADRRAGYRQAMGEAGMAPRMVSKVYSFHSEIGFPWGTPADDRVEQIAALLSAADRPTAIMAESAQAAGAACVAAARIGVRIPDELSLVAVHDRETIDGTGTFISTAETPLARVGDQAVEMLLQKLDAGDRGGVMRSIAVPYASRWGGRTMVRPPEA